MDEQARQLTAAHKSVIDALGRAMALYGLPVALGRTYALLYLSDNPLSVTEIPARLGVTKGTASVNVRMLERLHLVRQVWQPGRRGKFYVAERDSRRALGELMRTTATAELQKINATLAESERLLAEAEAGPDVDGRERARAQRAKVATLRQQYEGSYKLLQSFVDAMASTRIGRPSIGEG